MDPDPPRADRGTEETLRNPMRAIIRELIETAILAVLIFVSLQLSIQPYKVEGSSMEPALEEGEHLMVNKFVYLNYQQRGILKNVPFASEGESDSAHLFHPPRHGEIVVFKFPIDPSRSFVKRVIGVPGDTIEIKDGRVFLNGELSHEPYVEHKGRRNMKPTVVPADSYFVMGDNRSASDDSRNWGAVPAENVIGRAWVSYWPPDRLLAHLPFMD